jgi:hypothetical protein
MANSRTNRWYWKQILLVVFILGSYAGWKFWMTRSQEFYAAYYRTKIPAGIELTAPVFVYVAKTNGFRPSEYFDPCAVAIYRISDDTARQLEERGLGFFEGVQRWREIPDWFKKRTWTGSGDFTYHDWKPTPVPSGWTSDGSWFFCLPDDYPLELNGLIDAAGQKGNFYTQTNSSGLIVLYPKLKTVIYSYSHF